MSITQKPLSHLDYEQTMQSSYNDVNATLSVDGFLTGKVGRKVELAISSDSLTPGVISGVDNVETYSFSESGTALYSLRIIYTDGSRALMISAERIS
jgi:hypothetical protein